MTQLPKHAQLDELFDCSENYTVSAESSLSMRVAVHDRRVILGHMQPVQIAIWRCSGETPSTHVWRAPPQYNGRIVTGNARHSTSMATHGVSVSQITVYGTQ